MDGGLTNPVPVSAVRATGADIVIAVDLNHQIVAGKNLKSLLPAAKTTGAEDKAFIMFSRWTGDS